MKPGAWLIPIALIGCGQAEGPKLKSMAAWRSALAAQAPADLEPRLANAKVSLGLALYAQHCLACHGASLLGNGPSGASLHPRPSNLMVEARQHPPADIYGDIALGLSGTSMVAWKDKLSEDQIIAIVAYIRAQVPDPYTP